MKLDKIYSEQSQISGEVNVLEGKKERRLLVAGVTQSILRLDGSERGVWKGLLPDTKPNSVLLLGLGGGTVVGLLRKRWPGVRIVAYELDPVVVRVATSYFDLDPSVEVRIADARQSLITGEKYDLVIVDTYLGTNIAPFALEDKFLIGLRGLLTNSGQAVLNRIPYVTSRSELSNFEVRLEAIFSKVSPKRADRNLVYWVK